MLTRALIVLLLVLNLGVAIWWLLRPALPIEEHRPAVGNATLLELVEAPAGPAEGVEAGPAEAPARDPADPVPEACHRLGPFSDSDAAAAALDRLAPQVVLARLRREWPEAGQSWRVYHQGASVDAAVAAAQRIAEAGFDDYYVVRQGVDAGTVALGLYRSRARADARAGQLRTAGFVVRVSPVGGGDPAYWVEVAAPAGFDPARAASRVGADRAEELSCDGLVPDRPAPEQEARTG